MSSTTPISPGEPQDTTRVGTDGLYEPAGTEQAATLTTQLSEHLDPATRRSLNLARRSDITAFQFARSNLIPVALALGGLTWLLVSLSRKSTRG